MSIVNDTGVYFDPYDVDINADPYPRTHASATKRRSTTTSGTTSGHCRGMPMSSARELADVLEHPKRHPRHHQGGRGAAPRVLLFEDPPIHTMHRGLMSRVFTARHGGTRGPGPRVLHRCLDPLVGSGGFDIVAELVR